jgi:hypothetical protein
MGAFSTWRGIIFVISGNFPVVVEEQAVPKTIKVKNNNFCFIINSYLLIFGELVR